MKTKKLLSKIKENENHQIGESVAISQLTEVFYYEDSIHPMKLFTVFLTKFHIHTN